MRFSEGGIFMKKLIGIMQVAIWVFILVIPFAVSGGMNVAQDSSKRPGVEPLTKRSCPSTHPIKGNFTTRSGERCIFHMPGQRFYQKTQPERCYASPEEAESDGCRASKV